MPPGNSQMELIRSVGPLPRWIRSHNKMRLMPKKQHRPVRNSAQAEGLRALVDGIAREVGTDKEKGGFGKMEDAQISKNKGLIPSARRTKSTRKRIDHGIARENKYETNNEFSHNRLDETLQKENDQKCAVSASKSNRIIPLSDEEFKDF